MIVFHLALKAPGNPIKRVVEEVWIARLKDDQTAFRVHHPSDCWIWFWPIRRCDFFVVPSMIRRVLGIVSDILSVAVGASIYHQLDPDAEMSISLSRT